MVARDHPLAQPRLRTLVLCLSRIGQGAKGTVPQVELCVVAESPEKISPTQTHLVKTSATPIRITPHLYNINLLHIHDLSQFITPWFTLLESNNFLLTQTPQIHAFRERRWTWIDKEGLHSMSIKIEKYYLEEIWSDNAFTGNRKSEGNVTRYDNAVNQTIRSNINFLRVRVMESVSGIQQKVEQNISVCIVNHAGGSNLRGRKQEIGLLPSA